MPSGQIGQVTGPAAEAVKSGQDITVASGDGTITYHPDGTYTYRDNWTGEESTGTAITTDTADVPEEETEDVPGATSDQQDAYAWIVETINNWGLAPEAGDWAWNQILDGTPAARVLTDLYETDFFKDAFPEAEMRQARGFSWMPPAQILAYRDEATRIGLKYGYSNVTHEQISEYIGRNKSIAEFEDEMEIAERVRLHGGAVKDLFEQTYGIDLDNRQLADFFDPSVNTAELHRDYENARYMGQSVGFGFRQLSLREAELLRTMGIDPDQELATLSRMAQNAPTVGKFSAMEAGIAGQLPDDFGSFMKEVPNELLLSGDLFQNPAARAFIQNLYAREVGRALQGGGAAFNQGVATGIAKPGE